MILGMSINARIRDALSVDILRKLTFGELSLEEGCDFFSRIRNKNGDDKDYGSPSAEMWKAKQKFSLPQPNLRKDPHRFSIVEKRDDIKRLDARFNKRMLMQPIVYQDLADVDFHTVDPISLSPSLPYGFKCDLLKNK